MSPIIGSDWSVQDIYKADEISYDPRTQHHSNTQGLIFVGFHYRNSTESYECLWHPKANNEAVRFDKVLNLILYGRLRSEEKSSSLTSDVRSYCKILERSTCHITYMILQ